MNNGKNPLKSGEIGNLKKYDLSVAEQDDVLKYVGSVITKENILRDSLNYKGTRVITFANILKYEQFPLTKIIKYLMKLGEKSLGCPVEIEFAINLNQNIKEFCLLQIRPMVIGSSDENINVNSFKKHNSLVCYSEQVLGDGVIDNISHIIYIDPLKFKRDKTKEIAKEVGYLNNKVGNKKPYILIGPGRWGTSDHWLGIPINWENITNAKSIIEIGIDELNPDPSFGSHFFQNISNLRIGYFTLNKKYQEKSINWDWIRSQKNIANTDYVNVVSLKNPLYIKIDGIKGIGAILKNRQINKDKMNEEESSGI